VVAAVGVVSATAGALAVATGAGSVAAAGALAVAAGAGSVAAAGALAVAAGAGSATAGALAVAVAQWSEIIFIPVTITLLSEGLAFADTFALCPTISTSCPMCGFRSTVLLVILKLCAVPSSATV
jgi:hypothetical protein